MTKSILLCSTGQISDPGSRGFSIAQDSHVLSGFIVRRDDHFYAYINQCPHTGAPLDWVEHQFLDREHAFIQCAVHDARFQIDSGLCVAGPCAGDALQPLDIRIHKQAIYLDLQ